MVTTPERTRTMAPDAPSDVPDLEHLVPIAVVIAAGCEPCAERMVRRALENGASPRHVRKVIGLVAHLHDQDCFAREVGEPAVRRMDAPIARGRKTLEQQSVVDAVRERYARIATERSSCCGSSSASTSEALGYTSAELASVAPEQEVLGLGCGAPVEPLDLRPGETVLDLGSGAGLDACLAARKVGPEGKVMGVDMTPEMLRRARDAAKHAGLANVEFLEGRLEQLPIEDGSVDAVTSNCVINLVPDKRRVFEEIARVLKPGGRLVISDIVLAGRLPEVLERSILAWVGCVAGAQQREEYFETVRGAGLDRIEILKELDLATLADGMLPEGADGLLADAGVTLDDLRGKVLSVTFRAVKPA